MPISKGIPHPNSMATLKITTVAASKPTKLLHGGPSHQNIPVAATRETNENLKMSQLSCTAPRRSNVLITIKRNAMSAGQIFQTHNENKNPKNGFVEELDGDEEMRLTDHLSGRHLKLANDLIELLWEVRAFMSAA